MGLRKAVAAVLVVVSMAAGPAHAGDGDAAGFIRTLADRAVTALTGKDLDRREREARFRDILHDHFAVATIGQWVLGRYWRIATEAERTEYLALFEDLIVATYVTRFADYKGETLEVGQIEVRDADILVHSDLVSPEPVVRTTMIWRLRASGETFKIVDLMVAGISMGQTQRSEFASVINENGGTVAGLIRALRQRLSKDAKRL